MRKPTFWFPTRSDTNQAVQSMKIARIMNCHIYKVEVLYYPCSENNGAGQLRSASFFSHMQDNVFLTRRLKCIHAC